MTTMARNPQRNYQGLKPHRDFAAFVAIALRSKGVNFSARALPPFNPPLRPSATAAGSFSLAGAFCPVACWTMSKARVFVSRLLERLGMV